MPKNKNKNMYAQARWQLGKMSQEELAHEMNVTKQTVHNWENKIHHPSLSQIYKLSKLLKLDIKEIVMYYNKEE